MFNWSKQVILLTGGTGSFGQAFTERLLKYHPPRILRIYSRDEYKQYIMEKKFSHKCMRYFIGDVRDEERLKRAMDGVTLLVHAAAMKQIVASEYNPTEAIKTNILGSMNVLNVGVDAKVDRIFGLITDKAVSPINLYGATKLCVEKLLIQGNYYVGRRKTKISCVRYGNVAGSRGSVIPLFLEQNKKGTLTVTHEDMTRFWITLEDGVKHVMRFIEIMQGNEVFIPKMPSFRVTDLVKAINSHTKINYIGVRSGEKLHEDLITVHEARNIREHPAYYVLFPNRYFEKNRHINQGKRVKPNFAYNSATNSSFLSVTDLRRLLKDVVTDIQ